jgi:hypothetical protein
MNTEIATRLIHKEIHIEDLPSIREHLTPAQLVDLDQLMAKGQKWDGDLEWSVAMTVLLNLAWVEAKKLGFEELVTQEATETTPAKYEEFNHNPIALCRFAISDTAGKALAAEFNFKYADPSTMWDVIDSRRINDNTIMALIGDDRGWNKDWEYFIAVVWCPKEIEDALGYIPTLL